MLRNFLIFSLPISLLLATGCGPTSEYEDGHFADDDVDRLPHDTSGTDTDTGEAGEYVFHVAQGGYVTAGPWMGEAWVFLSGTTTTGAPEEYSGVEEGGTLCLEGVVDAMDNWSGTAEIGFNLMQEPGGGSAPDIVPEPGGITVKVTNSGETELRVHITGEDGGSWCKGGYQCQPDRPVDRLQRELLGQWRRLVCG